MDEQDNKQSVDFSSKDEGYSKADPQSINQIVLSQIRMVTEISSKEFKTGYYQKKPVSVGSGVYMAEHYVDDTRKAYINAVDCLADTMLPFFDTDMTEKNKKIDGDLKEANKKYIEEEKTMDQWIDKKLQITRKRFQEINLLFKRIKFFKNSDLAE